MPANIQEGADTMHVIGAGLPRTGTLTQKLALEQLGLGPCYHWVTIIAGHEPEQMIEQMVAYNEGVKRSIPSEQLLVWEVGEGWEPLCEFLGVPVPDDPLPHENDRATFRDRVTQGAIATLQAWREEQAGAAAGA